ncbi:MAG: ABC transporter permease [Thermoanaerobaculia bacterium]
MRDLLAFVRQQVSSLALPSDREAKVVEEWSAQLEEAYEGLLADGLTDDEAWTALQRQIPDWNALSRELLDAEPVITRLVHADRPPLAGPTKRRVVSSLRDRLTTGVAGDCRAGIRLLVKERGFSAAVVLTLAVCLGANTSIFTVVNAVLLRPLPTPEADRLVALGDVYPTVTPNDILANDAPSYFDRRAALTALEEQAMFMYWYDTVTIDGTAEELRGMRATPSLFRLLRVPPALGRTFANAEGEIGAEHKVILSHGLWQRLYGGDPAVIGQDLRLGWTGQPYTIVGVMPPGFSFFDAGPDGHARESHDTQFWIPLAFTAEQRSDSARARYGFFHVGRLRPSATVEQVRAQVDALRARTVERFPELRFAELGMYTLVTPLQEALTRDVRRTLYLLWAAAGFVLLIGTINIANLALARSSVRARELATRLALGARRFQIVRQLVIEGLVPAGVGGLAAVVVGIGILRALASTGMENLPNAAGAQIDATAITFVAVVSGLVGLLVGLMPMATAGSVPIRRALAESSRHGTGGRTARTFRRGLVVMQVALSIMLLIGAALLVTSLRHLLSVDAGFTATRVATATIFPPPSRYPDAEAVVALSDRLLDGVRAIPGVRGAGMTSNIALSGYASPAPVSAAGSPPAPGEPAIVPSVVGITPGYFEAMGTPLVRGRRFMESDRDSTLPVAIVDERLAARLWPNDDPVGKGLYRGESGPYTVVGVVRDVRLEGLATRAESIGTAYFPHTQAPPLGRLRWLAIKTTTETAAIVRDVRTVLTEIDPDLPLSDVQTMTERTSHSLVSQRLATTLASTFGLVALFLSVLGVHGVLAYVVARRRREIGIRMALGSTVRGIFQLVFGEGLILIALGLALGLAGALALGRALQGQLFGVRATDPVILVAVASTTGAVALLACIAPALRATRVDPVDVLGDQ